jgi:hypothetical protein
MVSARVRLDGSWQRDGRSAANGVGQRQDQRHRRLQRADPGIPDAQRGAASSSPRRSHAGIPDGWSPAGQPVRQRPQPRLPLPASARGGRLRPRRERHGRPSAGCAPTCGVPWPGGRRGPEPAPANLHDLSCRGAARRGPWLGVGRPRLLAPWPQRTATRAGHLAAGTAVAVGQCQVPRLPGW